MAMQLDLKDHLRETRLFTSRAILALVVAILLLGVIIARMVYLQVLNHEHYSTLSQNNRVSIVPVAPTRGIIYDRNGVILAQNLPTFSLEIIPERTKDMAATVAALRDIIPISDNEVERFEQRLKQKRRFQPIPLRLRLSDEEVAKLAVNRHRFPGVEIQARLIRDYPHTGLAVHAVGYVGRINERELSIIDPSNYAATSHIGKLGIEKAYEAYLHGTVGYQHIETNVLGRTVRVLEREAPLPGSNITLTLDAALQKTAKDALGDEKGAVIAIDPHNGDILVFASKGDYDPNMFVNGIDHKSYNALQKSYKKPLFNRALQGQYPPGSTLKPFIGLAGLELDMRSEDSSIFCRGWYTLKGDERRYRDWKKEGHGHANLHKSLVESCDVYFYELAQEMGINRMHDFLAPFGFGAPTGLDIAGELGGILPSTAWKRRAKNEAWYLGETLIAGIGQGYHLTTPVQLAVGTATLANRGQRPQPHLLKKIHIPGAEHLSYSPDQANAPVPIKNIDNWEHVIDGMEDVIYGVHGTARRLNKGQPWRIAGKTGTAQVFGIAQDAEYNADEIAKSLRDHALFVAFAPADAPEIAIAVIVENGGSGGSVAAPIAGAVIDQYLATKAGIAIP